jgi:hypothetical protein
MRTIVVLLGSLLVLCAFPGMPGADSRPAEGRYSGVFQTKDGTLVLYFRLTHEVPWDQLSGQVVTTVAGRHGKSEALGFTAQYDQDKNEIILSHFSTRRFVVVLRDQAVSASGVAFSCKPMDKTSGGEAEAPRGSGWAGKWQAYDGSNTVVTIAGDVHKHNLRGSCDYTLSARVHSHDDFSGFKYLSATHVKFQGSGTFVNEDFTETHQFTGEMKLEGDTLSFTYTPVDRRITWNKTYGHYDPPAPAVTTVALRRMR